MGGAEAKAAPEAPADSAADPVQKLPLKRRDGACRLCFEGGGDLIAPCLCKGTSKWIHRDCLNRWRASTANPRSLTHCCECGFQYQLNLVRVIDSEGESRRRRFLGMLAAQGVGCFLTLQLVIILTGLLIRWIDDGEELVRFFGFPQDEGQEKPGDFLNAIRHHKITYYVASVLALLLLVGVVTAAVGLAWLCCGDSSRSSRSSRRSDCLCCPDPCPRHGVICYPDDCCIICADSCRGCRGCRVCEGNCPCNNISIGGDSPLAVLLIVVVVVFILIGLFAAIMALVTVIQRAVQQYALLTQMRVLAEEYVVKDLAEEVPEAPDAPEPAQQAMAPAPESVGAVPAGVPAGVQAAPAAPAPTAPAAVAAVPANAEEQERLQRLLARDLDGLLGAESPPSAMVGSAQSSRGYGSV